MGNEHLSNNKQLKRPYGLYKVAALQDGSLVSASRDKTIRIWNSNCGTLMEILIGHTDFVRSLAVLQDGSLASGASDGTIRIWEINGERILKVVSDHIGWIRSLSFIVN